MKQLSKIGKRKCYGCKKIFDLNEQNFCPSKRKGERGFKYICRLCSNIQRKKYDKKRNPIKHQILEKLGKKCKFCGIESLVKGFFDVDHIIPIKRRYLNESGYHLTVKDLEKCSEKFQILCPNCHRIKTIQDREKYKFGVNFKHIATMNP